MTHLILGLLLPIGLPTAMAVQILADIKKVMLVAGVGYLEKLGVTATLIGVPMTLLLAPNSSITHRIGMTLPL